jgi:radical SAM-linked protein
MRIRARFGKVGKVRWTSHRDVARMWERALRRGRVPVAYTAGFTPRPQLSFGLALPTGCESTAEYLDIAVDSPLDPSQLATDISPLLPDGVDVLMAAMVETGTTSLQEDVSSCTWEIDVPGISPDDLDIAIGRVLDARSLPIHRERKGRDVVDDLRPSVLALACSGSDSGGVRLVAELGTRPRGVRPSELARGMGIEFGLARRTCQWIERDGSRWEPLRADTMGVAVFSERAS